MFSNFLLFLLNLSAILAALLMDFLWDSIRFEFSLSSWEFVDFLEKPTPYLIETRSFVGCWEFLFKAYLDADDGDLCLGF